MLRFAVFAAAAIVAATIAVLLFTRSYAGVRAEEIATLVAEVAKAESRLAYAKSQFARAAYLARQDFAARAVENVEALLRRRA